MVEEIDVLPGTYSNLVKMISDSRFSETTGSEAGSIPFHDEILQVVQREFEIFRRSADIGFHVLKQRFFAQVIAYHVRHECIYALIVRNACTRRVDQGHISGLVNAHQTGQTQEGVGSKDEGIQEIVVNAAIDDVHTAQTRRSAHVHVILVNQQVPTFDKGRSISWAR